MRFFTVGSDLDHKIKAAAAAGEPQWDGLGESIGLKVWRIEQFRVVPWPQSQYGSFHTGDSYVVLNSYQKEGSDTILHDLHIWIGKDSSQDEYGTAAYKMVEADESLGGAAVQHREVEGRESALFRSYFQDQRLTYLVGGAESGFVHVEASVDVPHLYRVKGTDRGMALSQVPAPLSKSSLNSGDCFILFANPGTVWVWHGAESNPDEKSRSTAVADSMCTEGTVKALDEGDDDDADFWKFFGDGGTVAPADKHGADEDVEEFAPLLFKLGEEEGEPVQVARGEPVKVGFGQASAKIPRSALNDGDAFLLDAGWEVFLWIGAGADRSEKVGALAKADQYCKDDPRTADLPLTMIKAGGGYEPSSFGNYFFD
jgi:gelsolin